MNELQELLKQITSTSEPKYDKICVVRTVNLSEQTCAVEPVLVDGFDLNNPNPDNYINNVIMSADRNGKNNNYIVPAINSYVIISYINNDLAYLVNCSNAASNNIYVTGGTIISQTDGVIIKLDNGIYHVIIGSESNIIHDLYIDKNGIVVNGGKNGGLVLLEKLITKINNLENAYNTLVSKYNAHMHTVATTGTAAAQTGIASPTTAMQTTVLTPTQKAELENTKFKQ